ncbi:MAG: hypothetical protein OEN20_08260, partial [Gammaproteobacteria bacterium]|nr:hypothetical protein [Gammaproteobacteria bacterium]
RVDRLHGIVGSSVRGLADRLDRFFSDERSLAEEQQSSMRLTPTVEWIEAGGSAVTLPINARLVLPRLEDKLRLQLVTGDDDASDVAGEEEAPPENISDDTDESRTFLGLVYTSIAEQARNISVRGGLRARDGALKAAASVRGRFTKPIGIWTARLTQTFFYDGDEFGERTVVDFDHPIDRATLFRSATGVTVTESSEGAELLQRFLLRRLLAEHTGVEFFVASEGHTDPVVVADRHITGLTYRKRVWKDWLTLSVRPELRYPRDLDFDREAAFIVALEAVF